MGGILRHRHPQGQPVKTERRHHENKAKSSGNGGARNFPAAGIGDGGLRAADYRVSGHLRHSCYPGNRTDGFSLRRYLGIYSGRTEIRHSSLYFNQRLRHRRSNLAGRAHRLSHCRVSGKNGSQGCQGNYGAGGVHAGGHPFRGLWSGGHDGAGAGHPEAVPRAGWGEPAGGHGGAGDYDSALHHQNVRHRAGSRTKGI